MNLKLIISKLEKFTSDRDWDQYHSAKNLAVSLGVEVGELLEIFQWVPDNYDFTGDECNKGRLTEELADIFIYAIMLGHKMNINIEKAILKKISINEKKYPIEKAKGNYKKHTDL